MSRTALRATQPVAEAPTGRPALRLVTAPKVLLYSHDTFGLGNIRRTLVLAQALREQYPGAALLLVTGSPMIHAFRIPDGLDYIKLPCLDRIEADQYQPRFLATWSAEVNRIRRSILHRTVMGFSPDLMIVDKRAAGIDGELLETLRALRRSGRNTRLVLGVRDILDEPARTCASLQRSQCLELVERYYDEVWIYGEESIFDAARVYDFPAAVAARTRYVGYLMRPTQVPVARSGPPRVLVTTGGGGDGSELIETYLRGLIELPRSVALQTTVIFGPQMATARREQLLAQFGSLADVHFIDFEADLTRRYAEADVVVSMAGYNTVCELLSMRRRAVLVPRAEPVMEQLIRARLFAERGIFDLVEPSELTPGGLMRKVLAAIARTDEEVPQIDLGGLTRVRERAQALLEEPSRDD
ncbi:MAG: glycosyltransferase [Gemmatimonadota bacterium]|nr:glycosyltransferase [Gemmatimonadota bacterium]